PAVHDHEQRPFPRGIELRRVDDPHLDVFVVGALVGDVFDFAQVPFCGELGVEWIKSVGFQWWIKYDVLALSLVFSLLSVLAFWREHLQCRRQAEVCPYKHGLVGVLRKDKIVIGMTAGQSQKDARTLQGGEILANIPLIFCLKMYALDLAKRALKPCEPIHRTIIWSINLTSRRGQKINPCCFLCNFAGFSIEHYETASVRI